MIFLERLLWLVILLLLVVAYITFAGSYKKPVLRKQLDAHGSKIVLLTFDDGPVMGTMEILDMLKEVKVRATFFVIGEEAEKRPDILQRIHAEGHTIGNHTWSHPHVIGLRPRSFIDEEINKTNDVIKSTIGLNPKYFRAPFGESTPYSDYLLSKKGILTLYWTLSLKDWQPIFNAELLTQRLSNITRSEIVLLHDRVYANPNNLKALKESILKLKTKGFTFITVEDLYQSF